MIKLQEDIEFYDRWHQDTLRGENELKTRERQSVLRSIVLEAEGPFLVVGCGGADEMSVIPNGARAIGMDISRTAVAMSRTAAPHHHYIVADAAHLPFRASSVRTVVCSEVIEHVRESQRALSEFFRVQNAEGVLVLTTPNWQSFYGLARLAGRFLLRRDFTSGDQPYDRWSTKRSLRTQLIAANFAPETWLGFWFFPPFGKGKYRVPERLLTAFLRGIMPLERWLRTRLPSLGHVLCVVSYKRL